MQIQAEMRSRIQPARKQILRHARGSAHVGLDDHVRNYRIEFRLGFFGQHALVQAIV